MKTYNETGLIKQMLAEKKTETFSDWERPNNINIDGKQQLKRFAGEQTVRKKYSGDDKQWNG